MSVELMAIVALSLLAIISFLLNSIRDKEASKRLKLYEKKIDDLNHKIHMLSKELSQKSQKPLGINDIEKIIETEVKDEVRKSLTPIVNSIKEVEDVMQDFQDKQIQRIDDLEDSQKVVNFAPPNMMDSNEKSIISQYKNGKSEAMIAKDLRIGIGEVDLMLKLANLK